MKATCQLILPAWESQATFLPACDSAGLGSGKRGWQRQYVTTIGNVPSWKWVSFIEEGKIDLPKKQALPAYR